MPDVRLSADFKDHKAGEIVTLSDEDAAIAPVRKVYPAPVLPRKARKTTEPSAAAE